MKEIRKLIRNKEVIQGETKEYQIVCIKEGLMLRKRRIINGNEGVK